MWQSVDGNKSTTSNAEVKTSKNVNKSHWFFFLDFQRINHIPDDSLSGGMIFSECDS